ncbi:hypothetical protein [Chryseobacterium sp. EZn1]|uniref:hypothetical protein n=1 Tax=Chryseobacterium cupriresistens TaxID=3366770 RepID=UPI003984EFB4
MKKKIVLTLLVLLSLEMYSQGGINTPNSKITINVTGNSTQSSINDGILLPRIAAAQTKIILSYKL